MDNVKSIAVPATRRMTAVKPRRAGHPQVPADASVGGDVGPPRTTPRPIKDLGHHRYRIGQRLRVLGGGSNWGRMGGYCKVIALMPHEGGAFLYRIRNETENFERVVAESDLVLPESP